MLIERGLNHHDISIREVDVTDDLEDGYMTVDCESTGRVLAGSVNDAQQEAESQGLAADLDHVVAWRARPQMITAALACAGRGDRWVTEPRLKVSGLVRPT